jgi:hypothetical protein
MIKVITEEMLAAIQFSSIQFISSIFICRVNSYKATVQIQIMSYKKVLEENRNRQEKQINEMRGNKL